MDNRTLLGLGLVLAALLVVGGCGEEGADGTGGSAGTTAGSGGTGAATSTGGGITGGAGGGGSAPIVDPLPEVVCTHYVDGANGSDTAAGTSEPDAWQTIQKAADTLEPGQTACILEGTYEEHVLLERSGAEDALLTVAAKPGDDVLLLGTNIDVGSDGLFEVRDASYVRVTGLRVEDSSWAAILARRCEHLLIDSNSTWQTRSSGIGVWRSDDVRVEANEVRRARYAPGGAQEWITMGTGTNFVIRNNVIHDGLGDDYPGVLAIDAKHSHGGVIEGNHIYDVRGAGVYVDGWDTHTYDIVIRNNFIHDVSTGILIGSERGALVDELDIYNNIVFRAGNSGIKLGPMADDGPQERIRIYNNTIVESVQHGGGGIYVQTTNVAEITIRNNIVAFGPNTQGMIRATSPAGITADHNLIFGESKFPEEELGGSSEGDPLFVDATTADPDGFRVQAGSPAIDVGTSDGAPSIDFSGAARPVDGDGDGDAVIDLGAYERVP